MTNFLTQALPVGDWVEQATNWLTTNLAPFFNFLQHAGQRTMDSVTNFLNLFPALLWIVVLTLLAFLISRRKIGFTIFTFLGLLFVYNQGLWTDLMSTVTLVLVSSLLSIIIGVPLGIWMAKSDGARSVITPILDFMQTMPGFVYLIPAVAFFGIGIVPGVFASIIFALPPTVRFTNLGIRQVPKELVEASDSFGGTGWQKLFKLELPLAKKTMMAGINQTTMLALSMVVIASMIGAPGLGRGVLSALQRAQVGNGFVNGVALVVLAIIIDRFTQYLNKPQAKKIRSAKQRHRKWAWTGAIVAAVALLGVGANYFANAKTSQQKGSINLAYVQWDTEVASTNVLAEVLREQGFTVQTTPLDNAIMWESLAKGEADATVGAWLPNTHRAQYKKYHDQVNDLGINLKGAKVGLVVPKYMKVNSIADLTNEADQGITGIEPGAGVVAAAQKAVKDYPNLADWQVDTSSSGAMTVALGQAIKKKQPIVITGWSPHWMFAKYDLKYLKDTKKSMGGTEAIHTMTRKGLKKDQPEAQRIIDRFHWHTKDMESVMLAINKGESPKKAAKAWIKDHPKQVKSWLK